jgi:hypothetical protein
MSAMIDLGSEILVDSSTIRVPQLRLLLSAIGQPLARGSAWVAVSKRMAEFYSLLKGGGGGGGAREGRPSHVLS